MLDLNQFDKTGFTNSPFLKKVTKPWGYELLFTPDFLPYTGKILHISKGKQISLQVHDKKQESYFLASGTCLLIADNQHGKLTEIELQSQKGYTVQVGQRHRLRAITDCDIFEVSTPELGVTYRLEDDYNRPDETEAMRKKERANL